MGKQNCKISHIKKTTLEPTIYKQTENLLVHIYGFGAQTDQGDSGRIARTDGCGWTTRNSYGTVRNVRNERIRTDQTNRNSRMRLNCSEWWDATKVLGTDGLDRPERSDAKELLVTVRTDGCERTARDGCERTECTGRTVRKVGWCGWFERMVACGTHQLNKTVRRRPERIGPDRRMRKNCSRRSGRT